MVCTACKTQFATYDHIISKVKCATRYAFAPELEEDMGEEEYVRSNSVRLLALHVSAACDRCSHSLGGGSITAPVMVNKGT